MFPLLLPIIGQVLQCNMLVESNIYLNLVSHVLMGDKLILILFILWLSIIHWDVFIPVIRPCKVRNRAHINYSMAFIIYLTTYSCAKFTEKICTWTNTYIVISLVLLHFFNSKDTWIWVCEQLQRLCLCLLNYLNVTRSSVIGIWEELLAGSLSAGLHERWERSFIKSCWDSWAKVRDWCFSWSNEHQKVQ